MDEQTWLACTDPQAMLEFLQASGKASDRKLRLFAVGCCRRIWHLLTDQRSLQAVVVAERYADGVDSRKRLEAARAAARKAIFAGWGAFYAARGAACLATTTSMLSRDGFMPTTSVAVGATEAIARAAAEIAHRAFETVPGPGSEARLAEAAARDARAEAESKERQKQAAILRCIFGNPFRPVTINPSCLKPTVVALAQTIYELRSFERMRALAQALEDAGCDDAELLAHCWGPGPYAKGCWAVDAVLGKS